ncbi:hypothetical protein EIP91_006261 [Steccherinum ochraceum]|uniref:Uncharacterized protein n=1 Tax=Steccherinum ochraceum TaxID=92696 RepID=A0A4R0RGQ3_9APHY|nr:hypothetical protein EIP91_006261 [Steccherinum ochraceum]
MMDIAFDSSWCPVCSRQILPKRIQVPITPPAPQAPAPAPAVPPSSPVSQTKTSSDATTRLTRNKNGTIRARNGGLVAGTGRVKPNGTIKRSDSKKSNPATTSPSLPVVEAPKPATPVRHRTIIDQGPIPLYCSDECKLADLQSSFGSMDINYRPDRHASPPPLPPVPHNSFSDLSATEESDSSSDCKSPVSETRPSDAYAALSRIYDLPPCPPPPPLLRTDTSSSNESFNDYSSGVMMAARRIQAALCPQQPTQPKRASWSTPSAALSTTYALGATSRAQKAANEVIPGWTDGSNAWRASVYSFAAPPKADSPFASQQARESSERAYRGFVATSHRSGGVVSTMGESSSSTSTSSYTTTSRARAPTRSNSEVDELYFKFESSLSRRCESRASVAAQHALSTSPTGSIRSLPTTCRSSSSLSSYPTHSRRREVSLLKPGAEGKLLVPNVTMRRTPSSFSESFGTAPRMQRSPLSRQGSDVSVEESVIEEDEDVTMRPMSLPATQPRNDGRSWSYSDLLTYPIMQLPPKKEKRLERRVVDGKEVEVEVEVEVHPERKRLFLFPGKSAFPKPASSPAY